MRFLVVTDEPLVLENIKLNNRCSIKELEDTDDNYGFDAEFAVAEVDPNEGLYAYTCPKCGRVLASREKANYCSHCGLRNVGPRGGMA